MNNKFSENLKKIRKDNNLSQEQLADELGVSRQAISKWESSIAYPEMDKIIALCDKFNLNIDDLLHKNIREIKEEEESKNKLNKFIDDFLRYITDTINLFSNMSFKSKLKCLFEQAIIILILIFLSFLITSGGSELFIRLLSFLPRNVNNFINNILQFVLIMFCIISSIIIIIHIFKTRYLNYFDKIKSEVNKDSKNIDNKIKINNDETKVNNDKENAILFKNNENKIIIRDPKHSEYRFINGLLKFIVGMVKCFMLVISLFLCVMLISLFIALILSFLICKTGLLFVGILISILSTSLITVILILIIFNFVFNRKNDKKKMIWCFISSLIILGVGIGITFVGTIDFEILENNDSMLKIETQEYEMEDNLLFSIGPNIPVGYIESDIDNIKVEYKINKYCKMENYENNNHIHPWVSCLNGTKMVREFITNINNKKIIALNTDINSIVVYASKENIEKIKNNYDNYFDSQKEYDRLVSDYENKINDLENTISRYENEISDLENQIENYKEQLYQN